MFLIFRLLCTYINELIQGRKEYLWNKRAKEQFVDPLTNTYLDSNGKWRDGDTDHIIDPHFEDTEWIMEDKITGEKTNISEKKREIKWEERKKFARENDIQMLLWKKDLWRDVTNDKFYVIKSIFCCYFLTDPQTGDIVDKSYGQKKCDKRLEDIAKIDNEVQRRHTAAIFSKSRAGHMTEEETKKFIYKYNNVPEFRKEMDRYTFIPNDDRFM